MLIHNAGGNYAFLKGIVPYSSGVVADKGYALTHATLRTPLPVRAGFEFIAQHLQGAGRLLQSLCAIELRSPRAVSFEGFNVFNHGTYRAIIDDHGLFVGTDNPIARTNVAPELDPPAEPSLYAFTYSVLAGPSGAPRDIVVAGAGELLEDELDPRRIVRPGETTPGAMRDKAAYVLGRMTQRLTALGAGWDQVSAVNIYSVRDITPFLRDTVLATIRPAGVHGVRWHLARPPIEGLEFEMDVRGGSTDILL